MSLTGVLLAAGASRRFGSDKRSLALPDGDTLLVHCARRMRMVLDDVVVVLRPEDVRLSDALVRQGCRVCESSPPEAGMGDSIRCGVKMSLDSDGWLVMPGDLPLLRASSISRIALRLSSEDAVVPICHGRRGHPVGFSRRFRQSLLSLRGERGGRDILRASGHDVVWLNIHDPGIYLDVDRPEDVVPMLRRLLAFAREPGVTTSV